MSRLHLCVRTLDALLSNKVIDTSERIARDKLIIAIGEQAPTKQKEALLFALSVLTEPQSGRHLDPDLRTALVAYLT